nr:triple tyrosine motif-containing protein [Prevotella sp. 10(H)]
MRLLIYIIFAILAQISLSASTNKPHVINLHREQYRADNKNWSIGQDERGVMYFGNDIGLLEFDGIEWNLNRLPNSLIARSVAVLSHKTIFTGSYEEFGRWDRDISGKLVYTSLSDHVDKALFKNDDFWKIWVTNDHVYFQSFNSIYVYDYNEVKRIPSEKGFLFLTKVRDEFLVQQMNGPLFSLKGDYLEKIEGSDIFNNTDVRVILPYQEDQYLIGTATKGLYIYDGKEFREWNKTLSGVLHATELNCGILSSKGIYFFGTILDGIYQVNVEGNIVDHISSANMLQNNTILSLYEDNLGNVWTALDRGLAYIQYIENMSCYTDPTGNTGAVYSGVYWNDKLFIGTNQGVFYTTHDGLKTSDALSDMKLIEGTQGQVWTLKIIDDVLYCCHNKGLKEIHKNLSVSDAFSIRTGVFNISEATVKDQDLLILSTYSSIKIVDRKTKQVYSPGQISEPIINAQFDHLGNIWLEHFNRGMYRCKLEDDFSGFRTFSYYGGNNSDDLPYKVKIFKVGGRIVLLGNSQFYTYDDIANKIVPSIQLNKCFNNVRNLKQIIPIKDNLFWAVTSASIYKFSYDGYEASILEDYNLGRNLSLVNGYENISILSDSSSLICLDNGFLLYHRKDESRTNAYLLSPYLESMRTYNMDGNIEYKDIAHFSEVHYDFNTVTFSFTSSNAFASDLSFQYMLENVDKEWSAPQKISSVSYPRLPTGEYKFILRTVDNLGNYSDTVEYGFEVLAPWYQNIWAYMLYTILIMIVLYIIWLLILRRYRNLHLQKIRLRETRRLKVLTNELQQEVEQKSAELLTQTSFIIQKNELILKIKDIIDDFYSKNKTSALIPLYQKINALLNNSMNSEDDWKTFLIKFEEKHTNFFKKMKMLYPQLTNTDLRLCACLKLNLETKEIASLMNLSVRAVENSRYRLRKKLNIQPSQNLNEFFLDID